LASDVQQAAIGAHHLCRRCFLRFERGRDHVPLPEQHFVTAPYLLADAPGETPLSSLRVFRLTGIDSLNAHFAQAQTRQVDNVELVHILRGQVAELVTLTTTV
jgi:hypothetical protein